MMSESCQYTQEDFNEVIGQWPTILTNSMPPQSLSFGEETWWKGSYYNPSGTKFCLSYALFRNMGGFDERLWTPQVKDRAKLIIKIIQELFPDRTVDIQPQIGVFISTIACFNDHNDTTFEDVEKVYNEFHRRVEFL
jgi:hypothetical protein